ncbi:SWIM zinc finger family protein [Armatimonas sp.]|uniref:SWIM zinc finger family protein n=1 Tax=Armatimonas sp. TaxID=1872638 RepID=UPI00286B8B33|nr:SWIM zinc finger family protein [Armatimonas sp.]
MRPELLALTDDDLTALTNRGTVKRARQELESLTHELSEAEDGTLTVRWSDDFECVLPAGKPLAQARCTCPAEPPCRHIVRSVMAYDPPLDQGRVAQSEERTESRVGSSRVGSPTARKLYDSGQLFELVRSAKPTARCHSLGTVTRFLVPGDPNFAVCDCGQPAPCDHAWMALWAFDALPPDAEAGLVDSRTTPYPVPIEALDSVAPALRELLAVGLASAPTALWDRLQRGEETLRKAGLIWPAECLAELAVLHAAYTSRDARFDPGELALLVGELCLRLATTRANRGTVPPVFVRGAASDRLLEIASAKLIGLGCSGRVRREGIQLTAFLQDEDSGQVVALSRDFKREGRSFAQLATATVAKSISLAAVAAGRTLVRGGKRTPSGSFSFGRAPAALHPQAFAWEKLRAPVLVESFHEIELRLATLPPTPLRPQRLAEDFHVVPIAEVLSVGFDTAQQAVVAEVRDGLGGMARLVHPYHSQGAAGCDVLLQTLPSGTVCFIAGACRRASGGMVLSPTGIVCEENGVRRLVQPWLESGAATTSNLGTLAPPETLSPSRFLTDELPQTLGDFLIGGREALSEHEARRLRDQAQQAEALGFGQLPTLLNALAAGDTEALPRLLMLAALAPDGRV